MTKKRNRVTAEITLSHVMRLAQENGCRVSHEQAVAFLNQEGRAYEMWKQMMNAGVEFILCDLLGQVLSPNHVQRCDPPAVDDRPTTLH